MKNIWAPWRCEYILSKKPNGCILCNAPGDSDKLIVYQSKYCFAIMNRFPYTSGHCMIAPYRHTGDFTSLDDKESADIMKTTKKIISAIQTVMNPDGFNVGWNLGEIAGAGISNHIHMHIVPRWKGDTNFMPVLADIHMVSENMEKTHAKIKEAIK